MRRWSNAIASRGANFLDRDWAVAIVVDMTTDERIAVALERIAAVLEAKPLTELPPVQAAAGTSIYQLGLSMRANNCLESAKVTTVEQLLRKSPGELLRIRAVGKTTLREIERALRERGLYLATRAHDGECACAADAPKSLVTSR